MNNKLRDILYDIDVNMVSRRYSHRIINRYYIANNIQFYAGDNSGFLYVNSNYYYYYIYTSIYYI